MAGVPAHLEAYLKAILLLGERDRPVRAKDVASALGLSRPSVSKASAALARHDYVVHQPYMSLSLTPKGRQAALEAVRRERVLRDFLKRVLGVKSETAERDATALEQAVSPETLRALGDFLDFLDTCRRGPEEVLRHFHELAPDRSPGGCLECGYGRAPLAEGDGAPPRPRHRRPARAVHVRLAEPSTKGPDRGSRRG